MPERPGRLALGSQCHLKLPLPSLLWLYTYMRFRDALRWTVLHRLRQMALSLERFSRNDLDLASAMSCMILEHLLCSDTHRIVLRDFTGKKIVPYSSGFAL